MSLRRLCVVAVFAVAAVLAPRAAAADSVPTALRVTAELHVGALSIAAGAGFGLLVAGNGQPDGCWSRCKSAWAMVGAVVGLVGAPFATWAVARAMGSQGELAPTLLGFGLGMQLDAFLAAIVHKLVGTDPGDVPTIAWALLGAAALGAPLAGSAAGAEW